jgi:predicted ribosomally synthesized peptide with SipW-like signal peptide
MKKLLFSFLVLGITSVLAIGATTAYFSDTEISAGNTFTAGTLQLDVEGKNVAVESYSFNNIKPGDSRAWGGKDTHGNPYTNGFYWTIQNTGSINGELTISIENLKDYYVDNDGHTQLASSVAEPRMLDQLRPIIYVYGDGFEINSPWTSSFHTLSPFSLNLKSQETVTVVIAWLWSKDSTPVNQFQGATSYLDVNFYLEQI